MEPAYTELLENDITATPPINIKTPKKVTSPVAKEIQKLRNSGSSDSEIVELLLETDGLTKPASPKNNQETGVKFKRQDLMFTATPPPIKRVLQPDSSEINKPQKQLKRTIERGEDRIPIKENTELGGNNDKNITKIVNNKFQQKIKIINANELIQKYPAKENLNNGYLKRHFTDRQRTGSDWNK